ncbi:cytochrome P450 [Nocardia nova]|uniref:hypothetical protein n=1 Tax=Nocardia nova TaxID=37330 RepID=UPI0025B0EE47|nr:hypothetical protein [Nocardia nova]MDN2495967.1 cytochrome P450 [Nocardia nova]
MTVVSDFSVARGVLDSSESYPCDPSSWLRAAGPDVASQPMLRWSPDVLCASGDAHRRLRRAVTDSLARVDLLRLQKVVESVTASLVADWGPEGGADVVGQFAIPLVVTLIDRVLGLSDTVAEAAFQAMNVLRGSVEPAMSDRGQGQLVAVMARVVEAKREAPGEDVASWLLAHPAGLSDLEAAHQLAVVYRFATEPTWNLIVHTLHRMTVDAEFGDEVVGGILTPQAAIDEVLHTDPPVRLSAPRFPRQMQIHAGEELPCTRPIVVDLTAATVAGADRRVRRGNSGHLAWGGGPHRCPAEQIAKVIAGEALDQILHLIPDFGLSVPAGAVERRRFPSHRPLLSLPVTFTPMPRTPE